MRLMLAHIPPPEIEGPPVVELDQEEPGTVFEDVAGTLSGGWSVRWESVEQLDQYIAALSAARERMR